MKRDETLTAGQPSQHTMKIITQTTTKLAKPSQGLRDSIKSADKTESVHREYMQLPCMTAIERGGEGSTTVLSDTFRVIAWNAERCLKIKSSAKLLEEYEADIILLSEMDNGMARTAQKHTAKKLAKRLGMYYLYGVEFLELELGSEIEREYAEDDFNKRGFHGNAILSKMPIEKAAMLRFDDHGHWFSGQQVGEHFGEPRVGGRMALLALVETEHGGKVCVVSTHFESNANTAHRDQQMFDLITAAEAFAGSSTPIIIGGDLNTGNNLSKELDHTAETLFDTAKQQGFHWRGNAVGTTTRPSLLTLRPDRTMKLDWFAAKGIDSHYTEIIHALDNEGMPLSDHEPILADWCLANTTVTDRNTSE